MGKINAGVMSSASDEWATPQALFDVLNQKFGFVLDAAATADNAKCRRFFSQADDGLSQEWPPKELGSVWLNPPYSQIGLWMAKANRAALAGSLVVCLVPARTDTRWWWSFVAPGIVWFLPGRLRFGESRNSAPFPSAVAVMWPGLVPGGIVKFWDWRKGTCV